MTRRHTPNTFGSHTPPRQRRPAGGFSILEVGLAMSVLAIGLAAIASIFPIATLLQKEAVNDVMTQQVARNVRALLRARKFAATEFDDPNNPYFYSNNVNGTYGDLLVHPVLRQQSSGVLLDPPGQLQAGTPPVWERWKLNDRSYFFEGQNNLGYTLPQTDELAAPYASEFNRSYYWVPLAKRLKTPKGGSFNPPDVPSSPSDWEVFVFILHRNATTFDRTTGLSGGAAAAFNGWANYDGFASSNWYVPGVRSMSLTSFTAPDRFNFDNDRDLAPTDPHFGKPDEILVGDRVLDNLGNIHTVGAADINGINIVGTVPMIGGVAPTLLWYGRPASAGAPSPTQAIIVVSDAVE